MKRNKLNFYLPWLLAAVMGMPFASCSGDDDKDEMEPTPIDNGKPEREKVFKTYTFDYFKQEGQCLVGYPDWTPSHHLMWNSKGCSFLVYLVQAGNIYYTGWASSNDTILTEDERVSKSLSFDVEIPSNINKDIPYDMIALFYEQNVKLTNGSIVCDADLKRGYYSIRLWNHTGLKGGTYNLQTTEALYVDNNTTDTITVRHKGFDVKEKWYYSKATVSLSADMQATGQGSSADGDVASELYKVAPGDYAYIQSNYVPTGKKMTDASLILEINGKEVKTPPVSSEVSIEYGKYYVMAVAWDGNSLEWKGIADEKKDTPAEAIDLGLASGTRWASYNMGATKPEEVGGYYAWGETETKDSYTWSNYTYCDGTEETCHNIGNDIGGTKYDVANVKWGGGWRVPSLEQWQEVIAACSRETVTVNGVEGLKLTSNTNGNSIFLPATGAKWDDGCYYTENIFCWLSTLSTKGASYPYYLTYQGIGIGYGRDYERFIGLPIRPVMAEPEFEPHGNNGNDGLNAPRMMPSRHP